MKGKARGKWEDGRSKGWGRGGSGFAQGLGEGWQEGRKVLGDNVPDDLLVNIEIGVDEAIPHAGDVGPRYLRELLPAFRRDACGGLADDFDILDQAEQEHAVVGEVLAAMAVGE